MKRVFPLLTLLYSAFLIWLKRGVHKIILEDKKKVVPEVFQEISIIIPARNERTNLPNLLNSLTHLDYPEGKYEIILINDHSNDGSTEFLATQNIVPNLKVIDFYTETPPLIGKKAALQQGIDESRYDILAFTDADCLVPVSWLKEINRSLDKDTDYLLSYSVLKRTKDGTIFRLKNFERSVYYALAAAGLYYKVPFTSSACNMVYRKKVFYESGGFEGIGHLRSGDDDLLLMKMMPKIRKAAYNPSSAMQVVSIDGTDRNKHHQTNIRRASKFRYHPWWLKGLSAFVFIYFCLFYLALWQVMSKKSTKTIQLSLFLKTIAEFAFSQSHLRQISRSKLGFLYPVQILIFPAQFIYYAVRGTVGKYTWK